MKRFLFLLLLLTGSALAAQESTPRLWLRGDQGLGSLEWADVSGNAHDFKPLHGTNMPGQAWMNYNPVLVSGNSFQGLGCELDSLGFLQHTAIMVYQTNGQTSEQGFWEFRINDQYSLGHTSTSIHGLGSTIGCNDLPVMTPVLQVISQRWTPSQVDSVSGSVKIGRYDTLDFRGAIAEFLLFPEVMSRSDLRRWQSYLALKYAITLKNYYYVNSAGDTVWNARLHPGFSHGIAGISRDDNFGLYQKQSGSQADIISIGRGLLAGTNAGNPNLLPNLQSLVWGHNNEPLISGETEFMLDDTKYYPLLRLWHMQVTGEVISELPTTMVLEVPGLVSDPGHWPVLLIDPAGGDELSMAGLRIHRADSVDIGTGRAWFNDVLWDVDHSGTDGFTFGVVGTEEADENPGLIASTSYTLFPNPTRGEFGLEIRLEQASRIIIRTWNSEGALLSTHRVPRTDFHLHQDYLRVPGIYFIEIGTRKDTQTVRLVVN